MNIQGQNAQVGRILRALACAGVIIGPYMYTMARPEQSLKYLFQQSVNERGEPIKVDSSYNRLATEVAYRMRLPEQMRRTPKFDIRSCVHDGLDFDLIGHFTPLFDGIAYVMVPRWANISSVEDLKKVKMIIKGQEIDFSRLDLSRVDQSKLNFRSNNEEKPKIQPQETITAPSEPPSWFARWFGGTPSPSHPPPSTATAPPLSPPRPSTPVQPLTRETVLVQKLIETFYLSEDAKKYTIADQFEIASGPWHMIPWLCVAGSFFLPFSLYTRLRFQFQTRLRRFLFFHFLLLNGLLCFYLSPFAGRLLNMQISRIRDSSSTSYGLDLLEGGIEFLEKQLERHRILRELLPNGKDLFDPDGERTKTRVRLPYLGGLAIPIYHWYPLIGYRLKRLRVKMNMLLNASDAEARKTIFKPMTKAPMTDISSPVR